MAHFKTLRKKQLRKKKLKIKYVANFPFEMYKRQHFI